MADEQDETQHPATLSNIIAGRAKEVLGDLVGAEDLKQEGEIQEQVAHEERAREHHREERTD